MASFDPGSVTQLKSIAETDLGDGHQRNAAMPTVAIFDLDGTITRCGTYTPFLWGVARRNPVSLIHAVPILAAVAAHKARLIERTRLKEIMLRVALGGMPSAEVHRYAVDFTDRCVRRALRPGALKRIALHKAAGDHLILATASFEFYAKVFGQRLGFDNIIATRTVVDSQGSITGAIDGENCRGHEKLRRVIDAFPGPRSRYWVVAYSDHQVDLPLLRWADHAYAVNPTTSLRKDARSEHLEILDWNVA